MSLETRRSRDLVVHGLKVRPDADALEIVDGVFVMPDYVEERQGADGPVLRPGKLSRGNAYVYACSLCFLNLALYHLLKRIRIPQVYSTPS